ncbi:MAG: LLM class flavin-dependent oxidoreductase [Pseudomonadota bacterium]
MRTFGLFLNMGANLGRTPEDVFQFTIEQARLADELGFHDLWLTEHHCIPFGINPSAITASAYILGATRTIRVGTAVTLSPLYHPLDIAERTAVLDQFSSGRFDLGLGRGGYLKDYELFDLDMGRWDCEPLRTAQTIVDIWQDKDLTANTARSGPSIFQPAPRSRPHPPLFLATRSPDTIAYAAEHDLPLQHYFAVPAHARVELEDLYRQTNSNRISHVHTLICIVGDNESALRDQLAEALAESFQAGDWPHVPQAPERHAGEDGGPADRAKMAQAVADQAIVGPPERVREQLNQFVEVTGATRLVFYMEAIADQAITLQSIRRFANEVLPG